MQYSVSEPFKVSYPISITFYHLNLVVDSLCISIGIRDIEGIQYFLLPVCKGSETVIEFRKIVTVK
jgi:hypothetical protein